MKRMS